MSDVGGAILVGFCGKCGSDIEGLLRMDSNHQSTYSVRER